MAIRDDSKPYILQEPKDIAMQYGGNKLRIQQAAKQGIIDPTAAVLAGMFIDQMRNAASEEQVPQGTVADRVLSPTPAIPAGVGALPPTRTPQPAMAGAGIDALPVSDDMYSMAGGGIVAFAPGGLAGTFDDFMPVEESTTLFVAPEVPEELVGRVGLAQIHDIRRGKYGTRKEDILKAFGAAPRMATVTTPAAAAPAAVMAPPAAAPVAAPVAAPMAAPAASKTLAPPTEMSVADWKARQAEFGINDDVQKKYEELIAKTRDTAGDRETAKNMALLQAGLGIMGGTSPYALQNIGEGAKAAVAQYGKDIKEARAAERDADKLQVELAKAQDAQKRGDFKAYQDHIEKAKDLAIKVEKLQIEKDVATAQKGYYGRPSEEQLRQEMFRKDPESFRRYQESMRPGFETAAMQRTKTSLDQINNALLTMKKDDPQRKVLEAERKRLLDQLSGRGGDVPPNVQSVIDKYLAPKQ